MEILGVANGILHGLADSSRGLLSMKKYMTEKKTKIYKGKISEINSNSIFKRVIQCCLLNGIIFWLSILIFNYGILPLMEYIAGHIFNSSIITRQIWKITLYLMQYVFSALWILPLFILSRLINCFWFQDIADAAYRKMFGKPLSYPSVSRMMADTLFSIIQQSIFLLQCLLVSFLPLSIFTDMMTIVHFALLYSLYSFDYKWFNLGFEINRRLVYVEKNWAYFLGFGLPLAIFTYLPSSFVISGIIFSLLFPIFILSANEAKPLNPSQASLPLQLFTPSIYLSNLLIGKMVSLSTSTWTSSLPSNGVDQGGDDPVTDRPTSATNARKYFLRRKS